MSNRSWQSQLQAILAQTDKHLAIVGVGHELRGDDAIGVLIARTLQEQLPQNDKRLVVNAGVAPENVTGQLRRFAPDIVLLIDAVDMQAESGTIAMIDFNSKFVERSSSTHSLSLKLFVTYLQATCSCEVHLIGIQPLNTDLNTIVSPPVQVACNTLCRYFIANIPCE